ncbi:unnamed protein product [Danaus chrysippus]|uniref:(African queen) hypothetical protein n=1 Tax=Danaus chrysippus TaxID=151541 RepID=A0A8J2QTF8_9NEOP|nr:unnamed protein product [Danaus chrysippus]
MSELRDMWPRDNVTDEEQTIINNALNRLRLVTKGCSNKEKSLNYPNQDASTNRSKVKEEELKEIIKRHRSLIRSQKRVHITTFGFSTVSMECYSTGHKFVLDDYDATYKLAIRILRGLCLKLTDEKESKVFSTIRNMVFWFMMVNVLTAAVLESICMMMTGSGGTLVELFTMMPCVGYLLVSMSKIYKIKRYKPVFINLMSELRDMWPRDNVTDEEQTIINNALNRLRLVTKE